MNNILSTQVQAYMSTKALLNLLTPKILPLQLLHSHLKDNAKKTLILIILSQILSNNMYHADVFF